MSLSAALAACTVRIPRACAARTMRTAISPRLAMKRVLIAITPSHLDIAEWLPRHHRVFVFDMEGDEPTGLLRHYSREGFHHLDKAKRVADGDGVALCLEHRLVGRGFAVEGAGDRGF